MSGYNQFAGMSNNAVAARSQGRYPASIIAKKLGVPSKFITDHAPTSEYHHVGSGARFNAVRAVNFYDLDETAAWLAEPDTQLRLQGFKAARKIEKIGAGEKVIVGCKFTWHTSNGLRKWHRMIEHEVEGCLIHDNGSSLATVYFPDGSTLRKNLGGNWVKVSGGETFCDKISRRIAGFKAAVARRRAKKVKLAAEIETAKAEALRAVRQNAIAGGLIDTELQPPTLQSWKLAGCQHPAPAFVLAAKTASGLSWTEFQAQI